VSHGRKQTKPAEAAMTALGVSQALRGKRNGKGYLCRCPVPSHGRGHGDRRPSLSIADAPGGRLLIHCHGGCSPTDVLAVLRDRGLDGERDRPRHVVSRVPSAAPEPDPDARALDLWNKAIPAPGTLAEAYLASRGIKITHPAFDPLPGRR
jgi:putative DNA primase/helicase